MQLRMFQSQPLFTSTLQLNYVDFLNHISERILNNLVKNILHFYAQIFCVVSLQ